MCYVTCKYYITLYKEPRHLQILGRGCRCELELILHGYKGMNGFKFLEVISSSVRVRVLKFKTKSFSFQPKGADRKQKTDREKMEKRTPHEKEKYQPSYETTILTEVGGFLLWQFHT